MIDLPYDTLYYSALVIALVAYVVTFLGLSEAVKAKSVIGARVLGVMRIVATVFLLFLVAILLLRQGSVISRHRILDGSIPILTQLVVVAAFFTFTWWAFRYTRINIAVIEASIAAIDDEVNRRKPDDLVSCQKCGFLANREYKHCPECGTEKQPSPLADSTSHLSICLACGESVRDKNAKFCPKCGKSTNA